MGVPLLLDVIRIVKPTHIVQFNYATKENVNKNLPKMTAELFASTPGWAFTVEEEERPENNSRWLKQISVALCLTFIGGKKRPKFAKLLMRLAFTKTNVFETHSCWHANRIVRFEFVQRCQPLSGEHYRKWSWSYCDWNQLIWIKKLAELRVSNMLPFMNTVMQKS